MGQHDDFTEDLAPPRLSDATSERRAANDGSLDAYIQAQLPKGQLPRSQHPNLFESIRDLDSWLAGYEEGQTVIGHSAAMANVVQLAIKYARSQAPVLLVGESGTGKEVFAEFIHHASPRSAKPFVAVNCAALPETLMESELFGHERGAFTGATERRIGRFESAKGGTLLLDEISEMPLALQAKLLRVLEALEFQRIGSNERMVTDVRIIATSNRDLESEVRRGTFRLDLYYRLNVLGLSLPPLRYRKEDIPSLAQHFLRQFRAAGEPIVRAIDADAMRLLLDYAWPGNVRELRNVLQQSCVIAADATLSTQHLTALRVNSHQMLSLGSTQPSELQRRVAQSPEHGLANIRPDDDSRRGHVPTEFRTSPARTEQYEKAGISLDERHESTESGFEDAIADGDRNSLRDVERELVLSTLKRCHGNKAAAARALGLTARTIYNKVKKYRELGLL